MAIDKISGTAWTGISELNGVAASSIGKFAGVDTPSAEPSQTGSLIGWWNPALSTVGDTTVTNLAYTSGYTNIDYYQDGVNGAAVVSLSGLNCWYLDGVNDRVYTQNINNTGTLWPECTNEETFTIEGWVRSNGAWIGSGNWWNKGYNNAYRNRFTSGGNLWNYPMTSRQTSGTFATNTWWHICVTMTNSGVNHDVMTVYKNGVQMEQWTGIGTNPNQSGRVHFWGGYTSTSESGRFYMGMCRRYTTALSAAEVAYNYDLEKADYGY